MSIKNKLKIDFKSSRFYLLFIILLMSLIIPLFGISNYIILVISTLFFYIGYSSSWNLLAYSGQVSFGHAAFLGIGGYVTAIFTIQTSIPWVGLLLGALASGVVGLLIGLTCVRLREWFLALVTFGFSIIMIAVTIELRWITGGTLGLAVPSLFPSLGRYYYYYYGMLALAILTVVIVYMIIKSKIGMAFAAIRENEAEAKATGINVTKYKLLAFILSAFFTGLSGAFYAHLIGFINPQIYSLEYSFWPLIISVIGGLATLEGPIIGSVLRFAIYEILRIIEPLVLLISPVMMTIYPLTQILIFGIILVVVVIMMPRGLSPIFRRYFMPKD